MFLANLLEAGEQPTYYFAYGMLTDPEIMAGLELVGVAKLPNFRYEMFAYANVIPEPGSAVYGCLWKVNRKVIADLDKIEGYPQLYDRKVVPAYVDGQKYPAEVYTMTPASREQLADTTPRQSYIDKIVRGYNHAGVPLDQVKQALKALYHRGEDLDEAAMNPGAFAAAVKTGQEKGVLVGFEFEVCIPDKSIKQFMMQDTEVNKRRTASEVVGTLRYADFFESTDFDGLPLAEFDALFKVKPGASVRYPTAQETYSTYKEHNLAKIKELFLQVPENIRIKYIKRMKENDPGIFTQRRSGGFDELRFAKVFGNMLWYNTRGKSEQLGHKIRELASIDEYMDILKAMMGTAYYGTVYDRFEEVFDFDPDTVYNELDLAEYEDDYDSDWYDDEDYTEGAKLLKPYVQQVMGANVIVYNEYHQATKNLTDWYIEPDSSLEPNDGDNSAEVVSPPLPAARAMEDLEKFYYLAKQLNLYTSAKNHTGLHINVSIPQDIDILKLAVFSGDQHVLSSFGRENSHYAQSVIQSLKHHSPMPANKKFELDLLQKIAQGITRSHYASVSNGGKYVSFRHAGGDYLNQYQEVVNTVGRFIRAMIIAADPNAYKQEYLKKLSTIFQFQPTAQFPSQHATNTPASSRLMMLKRAFDMLRQQGLPVNIFNVLVIRRISRVNTILGFIEDTHGISTLNDIVSHTPSSAGAKQDLINKARSPAIRQLIERANPEAFFTIVTAPEDVYDIDRIVGETLLSGVSILEDTNGNTAGYVTEVRSYLPPTDPRTVRQLRALIAEYKAELKRGQSTARRAKTRARNKSKS